MPLDGPRDGEGGLERARGREVRVLHDPEERRLGRERLHESHEERLTGRAREGLDARRRRLPPEEGRERGRAGPGRPEAALDRGAGVGLAHERGERVAHPAGVAGGHEARAQDAGVLRLRLPQELLGEAGLPHARLALHEHDGAAAGAGVPPGLEERRALAVAPHQRQRGRRRRQVPAPRAERAAPLVPPGARLPLAEHPVEQVRGGEPVGRALREQRRDHLGEEVRDLGVDLADAGGPRLDVGAEQLEHPLPLEGRAPRRELVEDDAERVQVGGRSDVGGARLLGRRVAERADELAVGGQRGVGAAHLGHAEVGDAHASVVGQEDVLGLQVAVDHPRRVERRQAARGLPGDLAEQALGHRPHLLEERAQRAPLHPLHDEEVVRRPLDAGLADVERADDVLVDERQPEPGLAQEPLADGGDREQVREDHLDREGRVARGRLDLVHDAHAPAPDVAAEPIAPEPRARRELGRAGTPAATGSERRGRQRRGRRPRGRGRASRPSRRRGGRSPRRAAPRRPGTHPRARPDARPPRGVRPRAPGPSGAGIGSGPRGVRDGTAAAEGPALVRGREIPVAAPQVSARPRGSRDRGCSGGAAGSRSRPG